MSRKVEIAAIIAQFDLNTHPFYQAWVMGTLPKEKLQDYAGEYARFVGTIASGWDTIGETKYVEEEREHEVLWADFRYELGVTPESRRPQTDVLVNAATNFFGADAPEAVGALYAFEAQQPMTARSKFDGLNEHYPMSDKAKEYFRIHADDILEAQLLEKHMEEMSDADFARAKGACTVICAAMWSALDGIYYAEAA
jgi:pyrroloquinoline quinone (PQQ) biosynthesis protein C